MPKGKSKRHYIGMTGIHGCMPSFCGTFDTIGQAADTLGDIADSSTIKRTLRRDHYAELSMHRHGNEYASIDECYCDNPGDHDESY